MAAPEYHFVTNWKIPGAAREVADVLGDPLGLVRWWPSVYLDVKEIEPGEELMRRRAKNEAERRAVPPPPGPTFARKNPLR